MPPQYLLEKGDDSIVVVRSNLAPMWFDSGGLAYVGLYGTKSVLAHDTTNRLLILSRGG